MSHYVAVLCHSTDVKAVKSCLESESLLRRDLRIRPWTSSNDQQEGREQYVVPTRLSSRTDQNGTVAELENHESTLRPSDEQLIRHACRDLGRETLDRLRIVAVEDAHPESPCKQQFNPVQRAVEASLRRLSADLQDLLMSNFDDLLSSFPRSYSLYPPMLLLPPNAFESASWQAFMAALQRVEQGTNMFFSYIAESMNVTHIAQDAPIPSKTYGVDEGTKGPVAEDNIVRSPQNLKCLYGDFGISNAIHQKRQLTEPDFDSTLWVSTIQNGITQIWAPMYTMFSSGNVTEKSRIFHSTAVQTAVRQGIESGVGATAVDLFAGIGYFAFSYAKAGISKVLCWDLNPWSIEGLRRGAEANRWSPRIFKDDALLKPTGEIVSATKGPDTFLVFQESNVHAISRIRVMRQILPPIRHINCGMLPTASESLQTAVEAIDPILGGWVHMHESALENDVAMRSRRITEEAQEYLDRLQPIPGDAKVSLEHIERVKSMGPRLVHVVLDIRIPARTV